MYSWKTLMSKWTPLVLLLITLLGGVFTGFSGPTIDANDEHRTAELRAEHVTHPLSSPSDMPLAHRLVAYSMAEADVVETKGGMPELEEAQGSGTTKRRSLSVSIPPLADTASVPRHLLYGVFLT